MRRVYGRRKYNLTSQIEATLKSYLLIVYNKPLA